MLNNEKNEAEELPMSEEEMRLDLEKDLSEIKTARGAINTEQIISQNTLQESRDKLIRVFFEILNDLGIDPSDLEAISNFLQLLEQKDPDLASLFQSAFEGLMMQEGQGLEEGEEVSQGEGMAEEAVPGEGMPSSEMSPSGAISPSPLPPPLPEGAMETMSPPQSVEEGGGSSGLMDKYSNLTR